jgi:hypothetical protein
MVHRWLGPAPNDESQGRAEGDNLCEERQHCGVYGPWFLVHPASGEPFSKLVRPWRSFYDRLIDVCGAERALVLPVLEFARGRPG